jgi:2OG-Fe(II) oxygenase superfamily
VTILIRQAPPASPSRSIAVSSGSDGELAGLRREYERRHLVRLPGLLEPSLLDRIRSEVDAAEFEPRETELERELCMAPGRAFGLVMLIANDPSLFEVVRAITACGRIGRFDGRVYRMLPGAGHGNDWHDDVIANRLVAMSVNLSPSPYSGGVLEIRDSHSGEILRRVAGTGPGEAVLFRIAPQFEHRVTAVEGELAKTAFVGFFRSGPDSILARSHGSVDLARSEA